MCLIPWIGILVVFALFEITFVDSPIPLIPGQSLAKSDPNVDSEKIQSSDPHAANVGTERAPPHTVSTLFQPYLTGLLDIFATY